jgi:predicted transcriptional regulator
MEIYNDILSAITKELTDGEAKPTRVQILSNLAYDKLVRYLNELEGKNMIMQDPLGITERGRDFLQDYDRIKDFVLAMGVKYLDISESHAFSLLLTSPKQLKKDYLQKVSTSIYTSTQTLCAFIPSKDLIPIKLIQLVLLEGYDKKQLEV